MRKPTIDFIFSLIESYIEKNTKDEDTASKLTYELKNVKRKIPKSKILNEINKDLPEPHNWLRDNWRPILAVIFILIILNNYIISPYLGFFMGYDLQNNPFRIEISQNLWDVIKISLGGYIAGRSIEKSVKHWKTGNNINQDDSKRSGK